MDKTVKIHAYSGDVKSDSAQRNPADDKSYSLELAMKDAQIEEEKSRSLEHLKTIVHLRESLKQEQAKAALLSTATAELEAKVKALTGLESAELAKKDARIEEEKNKSQEHLKEIEQLREHLKQEQRQVAELMQQAGVLEAKTKELAALEIKVQAIPVLQAKVEKMSALEAKLKELDALDARVKELTEALGKISSITAAAKIV